MKNTVRSQELVMSNKLMAFNKHPWKLIFLTWITTRVEQYFCYWTFRENYQPKLPPGWKIIMTKALSCDPINSGLKWDPLSSPGLQQAVASISLSGGTSQTQQTPKFAIIGGPLPNAGADTTPQGSTLCPSRRRKGIQREYFPGSERNFSQICTWYYSSSLSLYKCEYATANVLWMLLSEILKCFTFVS